MRRIRAETIRRAAGTFVGTLAALFCWGGYAAFAQAMDPVAIEVGGGLVQIPIDGITWPMAVVVVALLFRDGVPVKVHHYHHGQPDDD